MYIWTTLRIIFQRISLEWSFLFCVAVGLRKLILGRFKYYLEEKNKGRTRPCYSTSDGRLLPKTTLMYLSSSKTYKIKHISWMSAANPVQIFLSPPVVLLSFICRYALVRYQIDSNTTGSQKKIWSRSNTNWVHRKKYDCSVNVCVSTRYYWNPKWECKNNVTTRITIQTTALKCSLFSFILLIHEGSHPGRSTRNSNPVMTSGAKDCSDHRFRAPSTYTAQLPTLHQHRANNQYRTANKI